MLVKGGTDIDVLAVDRMRPNMFYHIASSNPNNLWGWMQ